MNILKSKLKGRLRGALSPIPITQLFKMLKIEKKSCLLLMDDLFKNKQINGVIDRGVYIPNFFFMN